MLIIHLHQTFSFVSYICYMAMKYSLWCHNLLPHPALCSREKKKKSKRKITGAQHAGIKVKVEMRISWVSKLMKADTLQRSLCHRFWCCLTWVHTQRSIFRCLLLHCCFMTWSRWLWWKGAACWMSWMVWVVYWGKGRKRIQLLLI